MTAYSFGNKWMGIIALKDPPSAVPEPLHRMAIRIRRDKQMATIRISSSAQLGATELIEILARLRHRYALREEWPLARECGDAARQIREGHLGGLRPWVRRQIAREHARSQRGPEGAAPKRNNATVAPAGDKPAAAVLSVLTGWQHSAPPFPQHDSLPPVPAGLEAWAAEVSGSTFEQSLPWLRWAQLHSSYLYELGPVAPVGGGALSIMGRVGHSWLRVALLEGNRRVLGVYESAGELSLQMQLIGSVEESLGRWLESLGGGCFGAGELRNLHEHPRARSRAEVATQVIGALCLTSGSLTPAERALVESDVTLGSARDWEALFLTAAGRPPEVSVERSGTAHAPVFCASIHHGGRSSTGESSSKKTARRNAIADFVKTHHPELLEPLPHPRPVSSPKVYRSANPQHIEAVQRLQSAFPMASAGRISQALTHKSWAYENRQAVSKAGQRDWSVLAAEGSVILPALAHHEHALSTLTKTLSPSEDESLVPSVDSTAGESLAAALGTSGGLLMSRGVAPSSQLMEDVAQAVIAAAWRDEPGCLLEAQPQPLRAWLSSLNAQLDPATQLEQLMSATRLQHEVSHSSRGPDHGREYQATYVFGHEGSASWTGPWRSTHTSAKIAAAAQILELVIEGNGPDERSTQVLRAFFIAEVAAAASDSKHASRHIALRRLRVDLVGVGDFSKLREWGLRYEVTIQKDESAAQQVRDYYEVILRKWRRERCRQWTLERLAHVDATLVSQSAEPGRAWAQIAILGELLGAIQDRPSSSPRVEHSHAMVPGAEEVARVLLQHAQTIATVAGRDLEYEWVSSDGQTELVLRVTGVDLAVTMDMVLDATTLVLPGTNRTAGDNSVSIIFPTRPKNTSRFVDIAMAASAASLDDPWIRELQSSLAAVRETLGSFTKDEAGNALPPEHSTLSETSENIRAHLLHSD